MTEVSKKAIKAIKKKITNPKNVSPVSKITRAAEKRSNLYKSLLEGYGNP